MPRIPGRGDEAELLRAALRELLAERDFAALRAADLERRAGLGAGSVARRYGDLDSFFAAVWSELDAELAARAAAAFEGEGEWVDGVRAALREALEFLADDPVRARIYAVEVLYAAAATEPLVSRAVDRFRDLVALGGEDGDGRTRALADGIVGGIWHRASIMIRAGRADELPGQIGDLMYLVVLPFRGIEAAEGELRRR